MRASRRTGNEKRYSLHVKWAMGELRKVYNKFSIVRSTHVRLSLMNRDTMPPVKKL